jgi:electron transport complex protein RnfB
MSDVFETLAAALDRLPNGFPRTSSGVELRVLRKIFSEEEARLAGLLTATPMPFRDIAAMSGGAAAETRRKLLSMAKRGLVWPSKAEGILAFRLAPFIVGIYEAQAETLDHELAHLVERYMEDGGAAGIMGPQPAVHRVVPAHGSVKSELILPYDDVRAMLMEAKTYSVRDCICRKERDIVGGRTCSFPIRNCMSFSRTERRPGPDDIGGEEALALLDKTEELGLVHTVSNVRTGVTYVCNCCGCCCGVLLGITRLGIEHSVAAANYTASIDPELCTACGACASRCQIGAVSEENGVFRVDGKKCIGCGLCVTGCRSGAASLSRKPEAEIIRPPEDFADWERQRLRNRGLA